jgi:glutamine amidotransferase
VIAVVDYGRGNLFSLGHALRHLGASFEITADPSRVRSADRVILPGVGAFGDAMAKLRSLGMVEVLHDVVSRGAPLLGICLGMQVLVNRGEEFGSHEGLGFIRGTVKRLPEGNGKPGSVRIPNVGWRPLRPTTRPGFLGDLAPGTMMYFVHSYTPVVEDPADVAATIEVNGVTVAAVLHRDNVVGYQFHPEKSGPFGLKLLDRFLKLPTGCT